MMYKVIKSCKLRSLFVMAFLCLSVFANITLISASAAGNDGIETSLSAPQFPNTSVTLTAKVNGAKSDWQYKFEYEKISMNGNKKKTGLIRDFNQSNNATWTPTESGKYILRMYAKDKDKIIFEGTLDYLVCPYKGICNEGGSCSLISSIQILYNNEDFRNLILSTDVDKNGQPYLYGLKQQFTNIKNNVLGSDRVGTKLAFDKNERWPLLSSGGKEVDCSCVDSPLNRLLNKCHNECKDQKLKDMITNMKDFDIFVMNDLKETKNLDQNTRNSLKNKDTILLGIAAMKSFSYKDYSFLDVDGSKFELTGAWIRNGGWWDTGSTHFYALVKDRPSQEWYKLDDSSVSVISDAEAEKHIFTPGTALDYSGKGGKCALQLVYSKVKS